MLVQVWLVALGAVITGAVGGLTLRITLLSAYAEIAFSVSVTLKRYRVDMPETLDGVASYEPEVAVVVIVVSAAYAPQVTPSADVAC